MQTHVDGAIVEGIKVRYNSGTVAPFAVLSLGNIEIFIDAAAECDELIRAAIEAKRLLLAETSAQDDAGRAIAADLDEQHGSQLYAVTEKTADGPLVITDPMPLAAARKWAVDNALFRNGTLSVIEAAPSDQHGGGIICMRPGEASEHVGTDAS